ncbi:hypothetical protein BSKO_03362 [Bryopsis sp. KO-2023]|nr:hypothetical protein BSKO_03362 [Bryopsis sp. KO-2023]
MIFKHPPVGLRPEATMFHFYLARHASFEDSVVHHGEGGSLGEGGQEQARCLATHLPKDAGKIMFEGDPASNATASILANVLDLPCRQFDVRLDSLGMSTVERVFTTLNQTIIVGTKEFLHNLLEIVLGGEATKTNVWGFVGWRAVWMDLKPYAEDVKYPFQYTPGQDWCEGHKKNWAKWFKNYVDSPLPVSVLEIGCWEGLSSGWWLSNTCTHTKSELWCVDHFDSMEKKNGRERRKKFDFNVGLFAGGSREKVRVFPFFSHRALSQMILPTGKTFDIIYVDGSHNSIDTMEDVMFCWKTLKKGGCMLIDDYQLPTGPDAPPWNPPNDQDINHPKRGIDSFLSLFKEELDILHSGYQVLVQKTSNVVFNFPVRSRIPIAYICDEEYAVGLGVALRSLVDACSRPEDLCVFVIDLGLSKETKTKLEGVKKDVHWIEYKGESPAVAKLRLVDLLPTSIGQFIYMDADTLVLEDICKLWDARPLSELSAAIDFGFPNGTEKVDGLSIPGDTFPPWDTVSDSFFNAGLFILDLDQVRLKRPHIVGAMVDFAVRRDITCDQDILNLFFRQWTPLDPRWNVQGAGTYAKFRMYEEERKRKLFSRQRYGLLMESPWIVHFTGGVKIRLCEFDNPYCPMPTKPWSFRCKNPFAKRWFEVLDQTPWKNWRPPANEWIEDVRAQVIEVVEDLTGASAQVSIEMRPASAD